MHLIYGIDILERKRISYRHQRDEKYPKKTRVLIIIYEAKGRGMKMKLMFL